MGLFKNQVGKQPAKKPVEKPVEKKEELTTQDIDVAAGPGKATRPSPVPQAVKDKEDTEKTPQLKEGGPKIYFSKYQGHKIGMVPGTVTYDIVNGVRVKRINKGTRIHFVNGRYVAKNKIEEDFLEDFMRTHGGEVFSVDPEENELTMELAKVVASHKASKIAATRGSQGVAGS